MMIRMVGGWMFLLVLAHPGSPRQRAVKRLLLLLLLSKKTMWGELGQVLWGSRPTWNNIEEEGRTKTVYECVHVCKMEKETKATTINQCSLEHWSVRDTDAKLTGQTQTDTRLTASFPAQPWQASTTNVIPNQILMKQENQILMQQEIMRWQWHQLDHMEIICTSLQTDNHASTSSFNFYRTVTLPAAQPTVSKQWRQTNTDRLPSKHYTDSYNLQAPSDSFDL